MKSIGIEKHDTVSYSKNCVPISLSNKQEILFCIDRILSDARLSLSMRKCYDVLYDAIVHDRIFSQSFDDMKTWKKQYEYFLLSGAITIPLLSYSCICNNESERTFRYMPFKDIQTTFSDSFNSGELFSENIIGEHTFVSIPDSVLVSELKSLLSVWCMYTLYKEHAPNTVEDPCVVADIVDVFNNAPSMKEAYTGRWSRVYEHGVKVLWPYRQVWTTEKELLARIKHCFASNVVSLWCWTNRDLESMLIEKTNTIYAYISSFAPVLAIWFLDAIVRLYEVYDGKIDRIYGLAFLFSAGLVYCNETKEKNYVGIDSDHTSITYMKQTFLTEEDPTINFYERDMFDFLQEQDHNTTPKTIVFPWSTYWNFVWWDKSFLISLLVNKMDIWDTICIPYFLKANTAVWENEHKKLYDNVYGNARIQDFLYSVWFSKDDFSLQTEYVVEDIFPFRHYIQIAIQMKKDILLLWKYTKKEYKKGEVYTIHHSERTSASEILNDFPPSYAIVDSIVSDDGLQWMLVLKKE